MIAAFFEAAGNLADVQRRSLAGQLTRPPEDPCLEVNNKELHAWLRKEFGFKPSLIRVKSFLIEEEQISVEAFPSHFQEFLEDPNQFDDEERQHYPESIRSWIEEGAFVLIWDNDHWMDQNGEVSSS